MYLYACVCMCAPVCEQHAVVRIVREKMLCTEPFRDQERLQAFLSQLYVFLVDEMHVALNKVSHSQPCGSTEHAQLSPDDLASLLLPPAGHRDEVLVLFSSLVSH